MHEDRVSVSLTFASWLLTRICKECAKGFRVFLACCHMLQIEKQISHETLFACNCWHPHLALTYSISVELLLKIKAIDSE